MENDGYNQTLMNFLLSKIEQAAEKFKSHDFKKALQLYSESSHECRLRCHPVSLLHNILSCQAALEGILGNTSQALCILNDILTVDPFHSLSLNRRSQIYKRQNRPKKALRDLDRAALYTPDNIHLAALKLEINNLMLKYADDTDSEPEEPEEQLRFLNLKKIDRNSITRNQIPASPGNQVATKERRSFVSIAGDVVLQYDSVQQQQPYAVRLTKSQAVEKFTKIEEELNQEETDGLGIELTPSITLGSSSSAQSRKSILKNRDSALYLTSQPSGRKSTLIQKLDNIEGKVIHCDFNELASNREVIFRPSISIPPLASLLNSAVNSGEQLPDSKTNMAFDSNSNVGSSSSRKSCLKRSSFLGESLAADLPRRRSKFEMMAKTKLDGNVVKRDRKSIDYDGIKESVLSENDSDCGSTYNIFGSTQNVLTKELCENLGFKFNDKPKPKQSQESIAQQNKRPKQSILKKSSLLFANIPNKNMKKKSVLFTQTH